MFHFCKLDKYKNCNIKQSMLGMAGKNDYFSTKYARNYLVSSMCIFAMIDQCWLSPPGSKVEGNETF